MTQDPDRRTGFGADAAEMPNETEVEAPLQDQGGPAPAGATEDHVEDHDLADISGVDNWVEEGGPLEPQDLAEIEAEAPGAPTADDPLGAAKVALAERTADLQRLQAEFLNYKRRVDRDRQVVAENATFKVLTPIVEVLDTIDRAREHGELEGGFKSVADQLERVVGSLGLTRFGEPGDVFDPALHEALQHIGEDPSVAETTCKVVAKAGYRIGDRVVRAAQVLVVDPPEGA